MRPAPLFGCSRIDRGSDLPKSSRSIKRRRGLGWAFACVGLMLFPALAQDNTDRFSTEQDALAIVSRAPGLPEGSVFATFPQNESVSLINGNLNVIHPSSAAFPLDGGGSLSLSRVFNSKNVAHDTVAWEYCGSAPQKLDRIDPRLL